MEKKTPKNLIISSWEKNAKQWIDTISEGKIKSRIEVTNDAIVEAVTHFNPKNILDMGCGEGWLTRVLQNKGFTCHGVDAIPQLISSAEEKGQGTFQCLSYEAIEKGASILNAPFDLVVFNFSLFRATEDLKLLTTLQKTMSQGGKIVIQTLHPFHLLTDGIYKSRWISDSWKGLDGFQDPYPFYARTLEDWIFDLKKTRLSLEQIFEPIHPATGHPASLILVASI